MLLAFY